MLRKTEASSAGVQLVRDSATDWNGRSPRFENQNGVSFSKKKNKSFQEFMPEKTAHQIYLLTMQNTHLNHARKSPIWFDDIQPVAFAISQLY